MRLHSYIVEHDHGFAPNPFHGVCTLATCKPRIRQHAGVGDYVLGTGSKKRRLQDRIVFLLRIGRIITFDEYWSDPKYELKRPVMNGSFVQRYGDNIYHRDPHTGGWIQEDSFHSREGGQVDPENLETDTGATDHVLIADWFVYWGGEGPKIPARFGYAAQKTQGHKSISVQSQIDPLIDWVRLSGGSGPIGDPYEWRFMKPVAT